MGILCPHGLNKGLPGNRHFVNLSHVPDIFILPSPFLRIGKSPGFTIFIYACSTGPALPFPRQLSGLSRASFHSFRFQHSRGLSSSKRKLSGNARTPDIFPALKEASLPFSSSKNVNHRFHIGILPYLYPLIIYNAAACFRQSRSFPFYSCPWLYFLSVFT